MNQTTPTNTEASFDLDLAKLAAIADRVDARGLFNAACDIRDWIQEVHAALARQAAPATSDMFNPCTSNSVEFKNSQNLNINAAPATSLHAVGEDERALFEAWMGSLPTNADPHYFDVWQARASLAPVSAQPCQWPTCQPEHVQQGVADQIHRELYSGEPAPVSAQQGAADVKCQYPNCGCTSRDACNFNYDRPEVFKPCTSSEVEFKNSQNLNINAAKAPAAQAEIVEYQGRMRPTWRAEGEGWTEWANVSKGTYEDYVRAPLVNAWQFEARALCILSAGAATTSNDARGEK